MLMQKNLVIYLKAVLNVENVRNKASVIAMLKKKQNIVFIILLLVVFSISIWKCFYGMDGRDESFYLTIPHRILLGDGFFKHEWHVSQMSGFLLLPFVWTYRLIVGSNEGIILAARIFYTITHSLIAVFFYSRIKKLGWIAIAFSIIFLLYTPNTIPTYDYYTISFDLVMLVEILLGTYSLDKKLPVIISGFLFACAVLCQPFLVLAYPVYLICCIIGAFYKKKSDRDLLITNKIFQFKTFLFFSIGAAITATIFFGFVFSRASVSDVVAAIPHILSDPEHTGMSLITKIIHIAGIFTVPSVFYSIGLGFYVVLLIVLIFDKNRLIHRKAYLCITSIIVISIYLSLSYNLISSYTDIIMIPMVFIGLISYILTEEKNKTVFISFYLFGLVYGITNGLGSNVRYLVVPMGIAVSSFGSLILLSDLLKEIKDECESNELKDKWQKALIPLVMTMVLLLSGLRVIDKIIHCPTADLTLKGLDYRIEVGPEKGILVTKDKYDWYNTIYKELKEDFKNKSEANVLILGHTMGYLILDDYPYATFSAWLPMDDKVTADNLEEYYKLNIDKKPTYIVYSDSIISSLLGSVVDEKEYNYLVCDNYSLLEKKH